MHLVIEWILNTDWIYESIGVKLSQKKQCLFNEQAASSAHSVALSSLCIDKI